MKVFLITLTLLLSTGIQNPAPALPAPKEAREHIRRLIQSLPEDCEVRALLEEGLHGDGKHRPWMAEMKRQGVKEARLFVKFTWDHGAKGVSVASAEYLSDYCGGADIEITSFDRLDEIRRSGLEHQLNEAALARATQRLEKLMDRAHWKRAHGAISVVLTDDEWLPRLESGERDEIIDSDRTPLMDAARAGDAGRVTQLLQVDDVNTDDQDGWTALMYAAQLGSNEVVQDLLQAGAKTEARNRKGSTALMLAVEHRKPETVALLLESGADPNVVDKSGYTPLIAAVAREDPEIMRRLIAAGADIERSWEGHGTALLFAAAKHPAVVGILLKAGANANATDSEGNTPLVWAVQYGNVSAVKELLAAHAEVNATNRRGDTALSIATRQHNAEIVELLKQTGARD